MIIDTFVNSKIRANSVNLLIISVNKRNYIFQLNWGIVELLASIVWWCPTLRWPSPGCPTLRWPAMSGLLWGGYTVYPT